jgi:uncharacterized protein
VTCTAFAGHRHLASGDLSDVALAVKRAEEQGAAGPLFIFDDATGGVIDVDLRGSDEALVARLSPSAEVPATESRKRGRPTLGVIGREVTLLPRHWEWLNSQPGGASVTLRRLVDAARRGSADKDQKRDSQGRAYRFMAAMAGDFAGFEEAVRALFADDRARFDALVAPWPKDVSSYATLLAFTEIHSA